MAFTADNRPRQRDHEGKVLKGECKTRLYTIWEGMHDRCYNPNHKHYQYYGGKGITVCEEWNRDNPQGYINFKQWSIANGYTEDLTIDRIDSNGEYKPSNCQWASMKEQVRNRANSKPVTVNGIEYRNVAEACEALHREKDCITITARIYHQGMSVDEAFTEPIKKEHKGKHKGKHITIDGKEYNSISEACEALQLNQAMVCNYKRRHSTTDEQAILHYLEP